MSRTYKDRPYYVMVNKDGTYCDATHHHNQFGKTYYRTVYKRDEHGKKVLEEQDKVETVKWAKVPRLIYKYYEASPFGHSASTLRYIDDEWVRVSVPAINPIWLERERLIAEGREMEEMVTGRELRPASTKVVDFVVKDHCTINEDWDGHWWREFPCHKGLPPGYAFPRYTSGWERAGRRAETSGRRSRRNANSKRLAQAWNDGYELDDFGKDLDNLTSVDKSSGWW